MATAQTNPRPPAENGFVNLFKPPGITSMEALRQIKRITGQRKKVGHGGTMDPLAQGVLPVCFGQATRLMDHIVGGVKRYRVDVTLGIATSTYDAEGEVVKTGDPQGVTEAMVKESLRPWIGLVDQTPPMYSALKVDGERLYKLARAGIEVERKARQVEIFDIQIVEFSSPRLVLDVECGGGTYMRSLAHDVGEALGCGGHVADLVRTLCGGFTVEESVTLEELEEAGDGPDGWRKHLFPVDWVVRGLKSITLSPQAEEHLRNGQAVTLGRPELEAGYLEECRAYNSEGVFLALVRFDRPANSWQPVKVFQSGPPSPYAPASV
ncbi:MAG: tRNA pseudouridine(55) synthase TruB [Chloroflexi bacterium]|nr:tRNA pseudouridine(55) synthase TruB [Chloroflexota bacterium]MDA1272250.1 tRNA pseudouridine(55) synthase TruB [Chloroflexota bacterium]